MGSTCSSSRFNEEPALKKAEAVLSWVSGVIFVLTAIVYSAERVHYAYSTSPSVYSVFNSATSQPFPAVTLCPFENSMSLAQLDCYSEHQRVRVANCTGTSATTVTYKGQQLSCFSYNTNGAMMASSVWDDDLTITVVLNRTSQIQDGIGLLAFVYMQGDLLSLTEANFVDAIKLAQFWISWENVLHMNGTSTNIVHRRVDSLTIPVFQRGQMAGYCGVQLTYESLGVTQSTEWWAYTPRDWAAEVGGLSALFLFLHWAWIWLVMACTAAVYRRKHPVAKKNPYMTQNDL